MNKLQSSLLVLFTLFTFGKLSAQDFYNGCRGPKAMQMDNYINYSMNEKNISGTIIQKLFMKNLDHSLPDILLAAPNSINDGKIENKGLNIGYICELDNISVIGALGLFKDDEKKYRILIPQVYATYSVGPWTIDAESSYSLGTSTPQGTASITPGYGLNSWIRIGASATFNQHKSPQYQGIIRIELAEDHRYWLEGYVKKEMLGARIAVNL